MGLQTRRYIFWGVCIPLRSYLTYTARYSRQARNITRTLAAVIAYRWLQGLEVGDEGFFGGPAWWADSRKMHGQLWAGFAITGDWRFLAIDTAAGAANWFISGPGMAIWPILPPLPHADAALPDGSALPDAADEAQQTEQ